MIDESLLRSNFLGRDGFRWWIGQIPPIESQGKQTNGGGWGNRYKVRILGYHPYNTSELPNEELPWAQVLLPPTSGSGGSNYAENAKLTPGDIVFGFFLDGDNAQIPVIMGCFGRTSQVPTDDFVSPFVPFTGYTNNIDKPNGTLKPDQTNESNSQSQKSPRDIPPDKINKLNSSSNTKDEIPYYTGVGQKIVFANTCDDTAIKGIVGEINNLLNKIQNASNVFLNVANEIRRSVDKILGLANNLVGQMFNSLFNKLIPILKKGLDLLYKAVYAKVFAITPGEYFIKHTAAHLAGVASQTAMVPPVKKLEESISCVASSVVNGLFGTISGLLTSVVDNVKNFVTCAGTQFCGAFLNSVIDTIINGLSPALNGVSKILTPAFNIASFLRSGIDIIRSIGGLFDCNQNKQKCSGIVKEWTIGCGARDSTNDNETFNNILKNMNIAASIGKAPKQEDVTKEDQIINDNFAGVTNSVSQILPTDAKITFTDISNIKIGTLITPQFESATELIKVVDVNEQTKEVTVLRNYVGKAVTYTQNTSFSLIDPIDDSNLTKTVPPSSFDEQYGTWDIFNKEQTQNKNKNSPLGGCYTGPPTSCGGPKVRIFGGGGTGATATAILGSFVSNSNEAISSVKKTASIIGVSIDNPGSGYRYPPFIEFDDDCGIGYGAVARSLINQNGQVSAIYMVSEGENYPTGDFNTLDNFQNQYAVNNVSVIDSGRDYSIGDFAEDNLGNKYNITIDNGKIISVKPINRIISLELPKIKVKSNTGSGAILKPIIEPIGNTPIGEVQQVIDCIT